MNGISKWVLGILVGIILAGGGWNENKQWQNQDLLIAQVQQTREDIATIKQAALDAARRSDEAAKSSEVNSDKLDKTLRKLDAIIDKQHR